MRIYIRDETEKAYLLESISFKKRWIPKKAVTIDLSTERMSSYEMSIDLWALKDDKKNN